MVLQAQVGHMGSAMTAHYTHISERSQHLAALQIQRHSTDLLRQLGLPATGADDAKNKYGDLDGKHEPDAHNSSFRRSPI